MKHTHNKDFINSFGDSTPYLLLLDPTFVPTQNPSCPAKNINSIPGTASAKQFKEEML